MYLIAEDQFNDVVLQENSQPVDGTRILPSLERLIRNRETDLPLTGLYRRLLFAGEEGECPIFTFTSTSESLQSAAPSEAYVQVIAAGIKETYPEMTDERICDYLSHADGIHGLIPPERLAAWIAAA
jgi:hypothetical protein